MPHVVSELNGERLISGVHVQGRIPTEKAVDITDACRSRAGCRCILVYGRDGDERLVAFLLTTERDVYDGFISWFRLSMLRPPKRQGGPILAIGFERVLGLSTERLIALALEHDPDNAPLPAAGGI